MDTTPDRPNGYDILAGLAVVDAYRRPWPPPDRKPGTNSPIPRPRPPRAFTLKVLLRAMRRHWWQILLIWGVLSGGMVAAVKKYVKPSYEAVAILQVEPTNRSVLAPIQVSNDLTSAFMETQLQLLTSSDVVALALKDPKVAALPRVRTSIDPEADAQEEAPRVDPAEVARHRRFPGHRIADRRGLDRQLRRRRLHRDLGVAGRLLDPQADRAVQGSQAEVRGGRRTPPRRDDHADGQDRQRRPAIQPRDGGAGRLQALSRAAQPGRDGADRGRGRPPRPQRRDARDGPGRRTARRPTPRRSRKPPSSFSRTTANIARSSAELQRSAGGPRPGRPRRQEEEQRPGREASSGPARPAPSRPESVSRRQPAGHARATGQRHPEQPTARRMPSPSRPSATSRSPS